MMMMRTSLLIVIKEKEWSDRSVPVDCSVCVNGCTFILFVFLRVFVCVLFALGKKKKGGKRIVEKEICESSKS